LVAAADCFKMVITTSTNDHVQTWSVTQHRVINCMQFALTCRCTYEKFYSKMWRLEKKNQTAEVDGEGSKPYVLNKLACTS
jgi:hypothetical protein